MPAIEHDFQHARAAKRAVQALLGDQPAVCGIGITRAGGRYAVQVNLADSFGEAIAPPESVAGVPVVVHRVGEIRRS